MSAAMTRTLCLFAIVLAAVNATVLTNDNYDAETSGKSVFIKFYAPCEQDDAIH